MKYKLLVNAIEIYTSSADTNPKFYSKTDLKDFKVENNHRVILSFWNLGKVHTYVLERLTSVQITELKNFWGIS